MFWYMLAINLFIPVLLIVFGGIMWKRCPKRINMFFGYRTIRSMKNIDTWRFAHNYCGKFWWKAGWVAFAVSIGASVPFYNQGEQAIAILSVVLISLQIAVMLIGIVFTERALKRTFNNDGSKKD